MIYDVIVVGGGTSGLMASVSAALHGSRVLLLEKNTTLGKKLLLTGGGRCNVTNNRPVEEIVAHIPGNGRFLYSAFSQFNNYDIIDFFKNNGVDLKEEDHGRMFPTTNKARTILETFITLLKKYNVTVQTNQTVQHITKDDHFHVKTNVETYQSKCVIIATGGKSIPKSGSTGDGYEFARRFHHSITPLFPTEVPLTSDEQFIKEKTLQGLSLRNISLSVLNEKNKRIISHHMDMIFTHFGISGPAVLRCSSFVYKQQQKTNVQNVKMLLDCVPHLTVSQLKQHLYHSMNQQKEIKTILKTLIPERLALFFLQQLNILDNLFIYQLNEMQIDQIISLLKSFIFTVNGSLSLEKSFVTGGGINIKEIVPQTMMSKLVTNLFFTGEVLDIHGYTGGYNITSAFVTGYVAGKSAAKIAELM